jgi:acyl transferase domain-containing protein
LKDGIRRASVNNFGFGGSNAHAILEWHNSESCSQTNGAQVVDATLSPVRIYVLSAKDEQACRRMASNLRDYIKNANPIKEKSFLDSLAYTLGSRRSLLTWVTAFTADSVNSLLSTLDGNQILPERSRQEIRVGWVFTGQGAQWHAMGRQLIQAYPVFKDSILECDTYIKDMGAQWNIMGKPSQSQTSFPSKSGR